MQWWHWCNSPNPGHLNPWTQTLRHCWPHRAKLTLTSANHQPHAPTLPSLSCCAQQQEVVAESPGASNKSAGTGTHFLAPTAAVPIPSRAHHGHGHSHGAHGHGHSYSPMHGKGAGSGAHFTGAGSVPERDSRCVRAIVLRRCMYTHYTARSGAVCTRPRVVFTVFCLFACGARTLLNGGLLHRCFVAVPVGCMACNSVACMGQGACPLHCTFAHPWPGFRHQSLLPAPIMLIPLMLIPLWNVCCVQPPGGQVCARTMARVPWPLGSALTGCPNTGATSPRSSSALTRCCTTWLTWLVVVLVVTVVVVCLVVMVALLCKFGLLPHRTTSRLAADHLLQH